MNIAAYISHFYRRQGYSAEYQAVLDAGIGTAPSDEQKVKQNTLLTGLKSAGIWNDLDVFYLFATDGNLAFTTINWKNPSQYQCVDTGTISRVSNQGIKGDGIDDVRTIGFSPSDGVNYQLNNAEWGFWIYAIPEGEQVAGTSEGANIISLSNLTLQRINSSNSASAAFDMTGTGFKAIERSSSTNISIYNNLTSGARTETSTGLSSADFTICGRSTNFNASTFSAFWAGKSLTTKNADLYNLINTYLTSL